MADDPIDALEKAFKKLRQGEGVSADSEAMRKVPAALINSLGITGASPADARDQLLRRLTDNIQRSRDRELLEIAFNLDGTHAAEFGDRLEYVGKSVIHASESTARRRIDTASRRLAERMVVRPPLGESPYSLDLANFRDRLTEEGLSHVHFIVGTTAREQSGESAAFRAREFAPDASDIASKRRRQVVSGTVRDLVGLVSLGGLLAAHCLKAGRQHNDHHELCVADIAVSEPMLQEHLIIVGGSDTNIWVALASEAMMAEFGEDPPIRYAGDTSGYYTCDEIESTLSGNRYLRLEESGGMHTGYLLHALNPWNRDRTVTIVSGIRATGTQAALLALLLEEDQLVRNGLSGERWRTLGANNRFRPEVSAKVVRASRSRTVDSLALLASDTIEEISPYERISQRHSVVDFVYEE